MVITSNKNLATWGSLVGDSALSMAIIDHLLHHGKVFFLPRSSYRIRGKEPIALTSRERGDHHMNLYRRQVGPDEVEALHEILSKCGLDMKVRLGLSHWDPPYPLELVRKSAEERRVYAVYNDALLVATFTVGTQPPAYYRTIPGVWEAWDPAGVPALYANRLAVLPEFQGHGIGTWCMQEYERIALLEECEAIRLDAYDKHLSLLAWYEKLGYRWRETFAFHTRLHGETGMACYEKMKRDFRVP